MAGWNYGQLLVHSSYERTINTSPIDELIDMLMLTDSELENLKEADILLLERI